MKKNTIKVLLFAFLSSLLFLDACKLPDKEDFSFDGLFKPKFGSDFITPLAHDKITILTILAQSDDTLIKTGNGIDSPLYIVFRNELFEQKLDSLLDVEDITESFDNLISQSNLGDPYNTLPFPFPSGILIDFPSEKQTFDFDLGDNLDAGSKPQLKELKVNSGTIALAINNTFCDSIESLVVTISSIKDNAGNVLSFPFTNLPIGQTTLELPLTNSTFDLSGPNNNSVNFIYGDVAINSQLRTDNFDPNLSIDVALELKNMDIRRIQGNFGADTSLFEEEVAVFEDPSLFSSITGNIVLNSTVMKLKLDYTAGIPIKLNLNAETVNLKDGKVVSLLTNSNQSPAFTILPALESAGVPSNNPANLKVIDNSNYNLSKFISNLPKSIKTKMEVIVPDTTDFTQFVYNTSVIKGALEVYIPLDIGFDNLQYRDTMLFNILQNLDIPKDSNDRELIKIGAKSGLKARIINGLPINLTMDIIALDSNLVVIDTIFSNLDIPAAVTNAEGIVISGNTSILSIPIDQLKFDNLRKARKISPVVRMNSDRVGSNVKTSKIYSNQTIEFTLVGEISVIGKP